MIYPNIDTKVWMERYGISAVPIKCNCGRPLTFSKPIAFGEYRGVEIDPCSSCFKKTASIRVVPIGEKLKFWESLNGQTHL